MKKRIGALACGMIMLFSCALLAGCALTADDPENPGRTPDADEGPAAADPVPAPEVHFTRDTMPRIDGSTATIPLSEGVCAELLGMTGEEATQYIHHNTTHAAYLNLTEGNCDIIFVTPPSADEKELLGDDYEIIPVVNDAFVFLNGRDNPVESLTLAQIREIYRGNIKNWSEVGGDSQPILAYQRPVNSGSQTLFHDLILPQDETMEAPSEMKPGGMDELIEAVSAYESSAQALGYSVYYYAKSMYVRDNSKLLAVDGALPTDESIAAGTYPLVSPYYAVLRKDAAEDSPERQLLAWMLSDDGQRCAQQSGYVALRILPEK